MSNSPRSKLSRIISMLFAIVLIALAAVLSYKALIVPNQQSFVVKDTKANIDLGSCFSRAQIEEIIAEYVVDNPDIIVKSLENLQKKKAEESSAKASQFLKDNLEDIQDDTHTPIMGNKKSNNLVVLFYDYNCGYCRIANNVINEAIKNDHDFKVVLRPIPILSKDSSYVAKVALAVSKIAPNQFLAFHNELMSQKALDKEKINELIVKLNINKNEIENEVNSFSLTQQLGKNVTFAKNLGIKGAPSYIINGKFYAGLLRQEKFAKVIGEK